MARQATLIAKDTDIRPPSSGLVADIAAPSTAAVVQGLMNAEATRRLGQFGPNAVETCGRFRVPRMGLGLLANPLVLDCPRSTLGRKMPVAPTTPTCPASTPVGQATPGGRRYSAGLRHDMTVCLAILEDLEHGQVLSIDWRRRPTMVVGPRQSPLEVVGVGLRRQFVIRVDRQQRVIETLLARNLIEDDPCFGRRGCPSFLATTADFLLTHQNCVRSRCIRAEPDREPFVASWPNVTGWHGRKVDTGGEFDSGVGLLP
jgi:hypothetical protein